MTKRLEKEISELDIDSFRQECHNYFKELSPKQFSKEILGAHNELKMIYLEYFNQSDKDFREKVITFINDPDFYLENCEEIGSFYSKKSDELPF